MVGSLARERYISLTTFKADGTAVSTPVWVVSDDGQRLLVWTGESGVLTAATLAVLAVLISRQHWPVLRTPPRPGVASVFSDRR